MERIIGLLAMAAAGIAALAAWGRTWNEKDVVVKNPRYRGAY